jgi:hypothetical protein
MGTYSQAYIHRKRTKVMLDQVGVIVLALLLDDENEAHVNSHNNGR